MSPEATEMSRLFRQHSASAHISPTSLLAGLRMAGAALRRPCQSLRTAGGRGQGSPTGSSRRAVRDALLILGSTMPDFKKPFGTKEEVDPIRHLVGTATGWGGNPDKDAIYLNVTPAENDGTTIYKLDVSDVPVDGFWSVSLYDMTPRATTRRTGTTRIRSTTSQRKKARTGRLISSSAAAMAKFPTACRS